MVFYNVQSLNSVKLQPLCFEKYSQTHTDLVRMGWSLIYWVLLYKLLSLFCLVTKIHQLCVSDTQSPFQVRFFTKSWLTFIILSYSNVLDYTCSFPGAERLIRQAINTALAEIQALMCLHTPGLNVINETCFQKCLLRDIN